MFSNINWNTYSNVNTVEIVNFHMPLHMTIQMFSSKMLPYSFLLLLLLFFFLTRKKWWKGWPACNTLLGHEYSYQPHKKLFVENPIIVGVTIEIANFQMPLQRIIEMFPSKMLSYSFIIIIIVFTGKKRWRGQPAWHTLFGRMFTKDPLLSHKSTTLGGGVHHQSTHWVVERITWARGEEQRPGELNSHV